MSQIKLIQYPNQVPTIRQLALGDIVINYYDGKAYIKKLQGNVQTVVEVGGGTVVSASYALSASFASTAATASYFSGSITNAVSASYAITASYAFNATSASYALTASYALNASDILIYVKNQSGNNILKGMVVRITGSNNSSDIPRVVTASYENDNNSANTLGIANENITNGSEGFVMTEGRLLGIDTSNYISGQLIYLGPTGSITGSAPLAPLHSVRLGEVIRHQTNNGSIYVRIDNGYEIGELHDVRDTTTTGSYGDLLTKSGSIWVTSKTLTGSYSITGSLSAASFTGSLSGTSSFAISSSRAVTASYAVAAASVPSYETAWTSYDVLWTTDGETQPVLNDGTLTGYYKLIGKTCFVRVKLNCGAATTCGVGAFQFSLPFSASSPDGIQFPCSILDNGVAWYGGTVNGTYSGLTSKTAIITPQPSTHTQAAVTATSPFIWGNTDSLQFNGSYEIL